MSRRLSVALLLLFSCVLISAADGDTIAVRQNNRAAVRRSWFLVPIGFYQEETSVGLGVSGGYYFKSNSLKEINSISGSVIYTFRNQAKINVNPRFYTRDGRFHFTGNLNLRHYPDKFFGIGETRQDVEVDYTSQAFSAVFQPYYKFSDDLLLGLHLGVRGERILASSVDENEVAEMRARYGGAGWDPYFMWFIGLNFMYDTRDSKFYPQKFSNFLKLSVNTANKALGSSYDVVSATLDFRQYVPTWVGQVFAWQFYFDTRLGKDVPFRMLPTLGGSDMLRGFREWEYTENSMFALQAEYRIPIYWRLKAALFCSVGDDFDIYNPTISKVKVGYGGGLRFRLNDARVNLRIDFAGNNYGEFKFYITATEAF